MGSEEVSRVKNLKLMTDDVSSSKKSQYNLKTNKKEKRSEDLNYNFSSMESKSSFVSSSSSSSPRRIIFPIIHDNNSYNSSIPSAQSIESTSSYNTNNTQELDELDELVSTRSRNSMDVRKQAGSPQKTSDFPTSILRRKTSSQSSLSIISEDGSYYLGSDLVQEGNASNSKPRSATSSTSSLQSLSVLNNSTNVSISSIPSLVSSNSFCSNDCIFSHFDCLDFRRSLSSTCMKKTRHRCMSEVSFDPQVWIYEYEQDKEELESRNWYNASEIEDFKRDAIACIKEQETRYLSDFKLLKVFFNHPALVSGYNAKTNSGQNKNLDVLVKAEIAHILIVDPNELFLSLFKRGFEGMLPHVNITTAATSQDALKQIKIKQDSGCNLKATHGFDIVVIEERLLQTITMQQQYLHRHRKIQCSYDENVRCSGSYLIQALASERGKANQYCQFTPYTLLIGVSGHENEDRSKLYKSGADIIWKKPPPSMNQSLRNKLLHLIKDKRKN